LLFALAADLRTNIKRAKCNRKMSDLLTGNSGNPSASPDLPGTTAHDAAVPSHQVQHPDMLLFRPHVRFLRDVLRRRRARPRACSNLTLPRARFRRAPIKMGRACLITRRPISAKLVRNRESVGDWRTDRRPSPPPKARWEPAGHAHRHAGNAHRFGCCSRKNPPTPPPQHSARAGANPKAPWASPGSISRARLARHQCSAASSRERLRRSVPQNFSRPMGTSHERFRGGQAWPEWHFDFDARRKILAQAARRRRDLPATLRGPGARDRSRRRLARVRRERRGQALATSPPDFRERASEYVRHGRRCEAQSGAHRDPAREPVPHTFLASRRVRERNGEVAAAAQLAAPPPARSGSCRLPATNRRCPRRCLPRNRSSSCPLRPTSALTGRIAVKNARPRDLSSLRDSLALLPELSPRFRAARAARRKCWTISNRRPSVRALETVGAGRSSRDGCRYGGVSPRLPPELDGWRALQPNSGTFLAELERRERRPHARIPNLLRRLQHLHGFYIEITNPTLPRCPPLPPPPTLKNAEALYTPELKNSRTRRFRHATPRSPYHNPLRRTARPARRPHPGPAADRAGVSRSSKCSPASPSCHPSATIAGQ